MYYILFLFILILFSNTCDGQTCTCDGSYCPYSSCFSPIINSFPSTSAVVLSLTLPSNFLSYQNDGVVISFAVVTTTQSLECAVIVEFAFANGSPSGSVVVQAGSNGINSGFYIIDLQSNVDGNPYQVGGDTVNLLLQTGSGCSFETVDGEYAQLALHFNTLVPTSSPITASPDVYTGIENFGTTTNGQNHSDCSTVFYGSTPEYVNAQYGCSDDSDCWVDSCQYYCRYFPTIFANSDTSGYYIGNVDPLRPLYGLPASVWNFEKLNRVCVPFSHTCEIGDDSVCNVVPPLPYQTGKCGVASSHGSFTYNSTDCFYEGECQNDDQCNDMTKHCIFVIDASMNKCVPLAYNMKPRFLPGVQSEAFKTAIGNTNGFLSPASNPIPSCNVDTDCIGDGATLNPRDQCKIRWSANAVGINNNININLQENENTLLNQGASFLNLFQAAFETNKTFNDFGFRLQTVGDNTISIGYEETIYEYLYLGARNWINNAFKQPFHTGSPYNVYQNNMDVYDGCQSNGILSDAIDNLFNDDFSFCAFDESSKARKCTTLAYINSVMNQQEPILNYLTMIDPQTSIDTLQQQVLTAMSIAYSSIQFTGPGDRWDNTGWYNLPYTLTEQNAASDCAETQCCCCFLPAGSLCLIGSQYLSAISKVINAPRPTETVSNWPTQNVNLNSSQLGWFGVGLALADSGLYCRMDPYLAYKTCTRNPNSCSASFVGTNYGCPTSNMICTKRQHTNSAPNYIPNSQSYYECMYQGECIDDSDCTGSEQCTYQLLSADEQAPYKTCSCQTSVPSSCSSGSTCIALFDILAAIPNFFVSFAPKLNPFSNVCLCHPVQLTTYPCNRAACESNSNLCNTNTCFFGVCSCNPPPPPNFCNKGTCVSTAIQVISQEYVVSPVNSTSYTFIPTISIPLCTACNTPPNTIGSIYDCSAGLIETCSYYYNNHTNTYIPEDCSSATIYKCSVNSENGYLTTSGSLVEDNLHVPYVTLGIDPVAVNVVCECPLSTKANYSYYDSGGFCQPVYNGVLCGIQGASFNINDGVCNCATTIKPSVLGPSTNGYPGICQIQCPLWTIPSPTSIEIPNNLLCAGPTHSVSQPCQQRSDGLGSQCVCLSNFYGFGCEHSYCPLGFGGIPCGFNGICDKTNGRCVCTNNYMGFVCEILDTSTNENVVLPSQSLPYFP